ncbi:MAG: M20/M25/M40 family metallo-hydrolase, partial [Candidatus Heimdallarchaeota archaeon]|nr:M20/M25/M40 family metallo-hydrolase [Candidatus Heimdallarchaeota archaeon]
QMKEMEPKAKIILTEVKENKAFSASNSEAIITAIVDIYHGTISQSQEIEGLVQTSNNLAKVRTSENYVEISVSTRSSVDEELQQARDEIKIIGEGLGGSIELSEAYPGWKPNLDSSFLKLVKGRYEEVYGKEIKLRAIHAGLECGLFLGLDSDSELQVSSIGPTIKNVHSPDESVDIESVKTIWEIVKLIVSNMKDLI